MLAKKTVEYWGFLRTFDTELIGSNCRAIVTAHAEARRVHKGNWFSVIIVGMVFCVAIAKGSKNSIFVHAFLT